MKREPKFKIGQSVYMKDDVDYYLTLHNKKYDTYSNTRPRSITVTGILVEECDGGEQVHYKFAQTTAWIPEIALTDKIHPDPLEKKND